MKKPKDTNEWGIDYIKYRESLEEEPVELSEDAEDEEMILEYIDDPEPYDDFDSYKDDKDRWDENH